MAFLHLSICFICLKVFFTSGHIFVLDRNNKTIRSFSSESALFGPSLPEEGTAGHLRISVPVDACSEVAKVPSNGTLWIALIKRQPCMFAKKVFNVEQAGYGAAIVHNVGSDELIPMKGDDETGPIKIPSVFVGETTGRVLAQSYLNYTILLKSSHSGPDNTIFFLPFAVVLPVCTVIMCFFLCIRCLMDQLKKKRLRLSKSNLKKLPIKKFQKGNECEVCAVCLEEYEDGDRLRELPCAHAYHQKCIDPWLTKNKQTCPLCNKKVFPQDDDSDVENEENHSSENTPLLGSRRNVNTSYGISGNNIQLAESESDDRNGDNEEEMSQNHTESRVEIHTFPRNLRTPSGGSFQEGDLVTGLTRQPTVAVEEENAGFDFERECQNTSRNNELLPVTRGSDSNSAHHCTDVQNLSV